MKMPMESHESAHAADLMWNRGRMCRHPLICSGVLFFFSCRATAHWRTHQTSSRLLLSSSTVSQQSVCVAHGKMLCGLRIYKWACRLTLSVVDASRTHTQWIPHSSYANAMQEKNNKIKKTKTLFIYKLNDNFVFLFVLIIVWWIFVRCDRTAFAARHLLPFNCWCISSIILFHSFRLELLLYGFTCTRSSWKSVRAADAASPLILFFSLLIFCISLLFYLFHRWDCDCGRTANGRWEFFHRPWWQLEVHNLIIL